MANDASLNQEAAGQWIRAALEEHERPLTHYATRILGDLERARDVVQETFLRLCNQNREDVEARLKEWLFTVCRNQALDVRRKESRMTLLQDDDAQQRTPGGNDPPGAALEQSDTVSHVLATMGSLPEKQAEVLRLKFQHGLSYKSIADVTGETTGNVGWLIHVGLKALRARLGVEQAQKGAQA